jgi:hypothetical protein
MGKAFKCDRCPRYEPGEPVAKVRLTLPDMESPSKISTDDIELCAPCLTQLQRFLADGPDDEPGFGLRVAGGAA